MLDRNVALAGRFAKGNSGRVVTFG